MKNRSNTSTAVSANKKDTDNDIAKRVSSGEFKIAVYGLGHVGSPLASSWLRAGAHIIGVDNSSKVLENARKGRTHVNEPGVAEAFSRGLREKRFFVYSDPVKASQDSRFKLICVPVLLTDSFSADLSAVKQVTIAIARGLKKGDVVSLNPSVPPGTSEDVVLPILENESGLKVERDFYMVYNPERIYEGRAIKDIETRYPAVVAGAGAKSLEIGTKLYSLVAKKGVIKISNIRTAEAEKLLEGVYRDFNIVRYGRTLNDSMPAYCVTQAIKLIDKSNVSKCTVALLGLGFRRDVSDTRLSPTYRVIEELKKVNVKEIRVHDPLVTRDPNLPQDVILTSDLSRVVKDADLVMLISDHSEYHNITNQTLNGAALYDGRGVLDGSKFHARRFASIGRPS